MKLYIGNQNYSSWSLRAWLIFEHYQLEVEVEKLTLFSTEFYHTLETLTPTAKVPTLIDDETTVWDSLAILEYINEQYLNGCCWPNDSVRKAKARAVACEMHSGFLALRNELPMNCRAKRQVVLSAEARKDIQRIDTLWAEQMLKHDGQWLFGDWSIADAMFAPVALRFRTYGIELSPLAQQYQQKVLNSDAIKTWLIQASHEQDIIVQDEAGVER
ncbi:glutathione S-transferase family protein [Vibrio mediterranei]|uniref:Glutathione S-transferase n=1 Tax=Vibrio mediterranei TaxID=689 RepID=A0AAN1KLH1_9VIBR|nr:glutathione S-transferase family protein [Vibrio mediterranei]ASI88380.1 glutathione S-transferase [Vibrio mediterranei]